MKKMKSVYLLAVMSLILVFAAACGNKSEEGAAGGGDLSGKIKIDGSSTVFPIMEAVSEEFQAANPDVQAPVGVSGSGGGFEKFIRGELDLANASRPIKDEEKTAATEKGIEFTEFELAKDGLSVVVSKENDFIDHLTVEELQKMWLEEGKVKTWKDIRPEWPAKKIEFFSPGTDSGTYDYWNEAILDEKPMRRDAQLSEDDNVLVQGVTGSENAIGFFGYAYYQANKDKVKAVPIDGGNGPVEPNAETIESGEYAPLSRPLYTYVNNKSVKENEAVYEYLKFTLENAGELASSDTIGYVSLPKEKYEEQLKKLDELAGK
ncbi:PstS family phosphate ABC transporter substrate-binding protein [Fictibacillus nanhaiensis]|uniref:PstS family phosphate ABC transporter substrate-binding protein n=1 Tax=Fictibacillus nanhaiensis TaxID=742169 RepID=UPI001C9384A3|nr:PstS family phosphate ABC transporter substrate-binding protein [Fictibacillus nanhaiensis]MBY6035485.1 PstS family phosphate ABC transporter substrate-binding protein [Fictibacillus nanhaiensis]